MSFDPFTYLFSLAFIYAYARLAIHFAPGFLHYFLNEPHHWQKQLEKPRILFHLVGLFFMYLMASSYNSAQNESGLIELISLIVFTLGFFFCQFTWTEKFYSSFLAKKKNYFETPSENFNLSISDTKVVQLYEELVRFDLLNQELTSLEDLKNVLLKNWSDHDSKLFLKMDGPSCRDFYDFFTRTFPTNTLTLKNFFRSSNLVRRPDGKLYNYNTIKNAPTRNNYSKRHSDLVTIFQKIT